MNKSLKTLYVSLEQASLNYAQTRSFRDLNRALQLIEEAKDCLDDLAHLMVVESEQYAPITEKLEAVR